MKLSFSFVAILLVASIYCVSIEAAQLSSSSSSTSFSSSTSSIRFKANKLRRPESCRENLPRKSEDLPVLVITGRVKEVYNVGDTGSILNALSSSNVGAENGANNNKALVNIGRVIKGNQQLVGSDIIVSGFNSSSSQPCPNYVKPNDTYIMLLNLDGTAGGITGDRKYVIQNNNILSLNLSNLDRINAIANDELFKRRGPIENILCEAHYCAYGRCVANGKTNQVSCQCPDSCPPLPAQVCGSDNTTYVNECFLIKEGCKRQRVLFVTKESAC